MLYNLLAVIGVASLCVGLGLVAVPLAFVAFGVLAILYAARNADDVKKTPDA